MFNVKLYYFTGSGNTKLIVDHIANMFKEKNYNVSIERMEDVVKFDLIIYDYIGLLFPVYIQSTNPLVWDFIESLPDVANQKVFMIDTLSSFSGGIVGPIKKKLTKKGFNCVGAKELKMNSSIKTKHKKDKNQKAKKEATLFINNLLKNRTYWRRYPLLSDMMRLISKPHKIWVHTSKSISVDHERCTLCNICVKNCPTKAIKEENKRITIEHELCISCVRCIHNCPTNAILWKKKEVMKNT